MADQSEYRIVVKVDPTQAQQGLSQVHKELGGIEELLVSIGEAVGLHELAHQGLELVESYNRVQNRLRNLVETDQELHDVTHELFVVAEQSRSSFNSTADVYAKLARAAKGTGTDQTQLLLITKALNQEALIQGRTSEDLTGIVGQLAIALQSGTLNARSLRLIFRDYPDIADAIAASMGRTTQELKKLGAEGKITGEQLFEALSKSSDVMEQKFGRVLPTISQAFSVLRNNFQQYLSAQNEAVGGTEKFAELILLAADHVKILAGALGALAVFITAELAGKAIPLLRNQLLLLQSGAAAAAAPFFVIGAAAGAVGATVVRLGNDIKAANEDLSGLPQLTTFGRVGQQVEFLTRKVAALKAELASNPSDSRAQALLAQYNQQLVDAVKHQDDLSEAKKKQHSQDQQILNETQNLEDQVRILQLGTKEREVQTKLLETAQKLQQQGIALNDEQKEQLAARLRNIQALQDTGKILQELRGPQEEYVRRVQLISEMLVVGAATQEEYDRVLRGGGIPQVIDQLKQEADVLQANGQQREVLTALKEAETRVNRKLTGDEAVAIVAAVQRKQAMEEQAKVLEEINGPQEAYARKVEALNALLAKGKITADQYNFALASGSPQGPAAPKGLEFEGETKIDTGPLSEQLALMTRENELLALNSEARERYAAIERAEDAAKRTLTANEIAQITHLVTERQRLQAQLEAESAARQEVLGLQREVINQVAGDQAHLAGVQTQLTVLFRAGTITAEQYARGLLQVDLAAKQTDTSLSGGLSRGLDRLKLKVQDVGGSAEEILVSSFDSATDALVKFTDGGAHAFSDFASSLLKDIQRLAAQQLLGSLLGLGAGGGGILGILGIGAKAEGGDVAGNKPYVVGEKGPELFIPRGAGYVVPARQTAAALGSQGAAPRVSVAPPRVDVHVSNSLDSREVVRSGLQTREGEQEVLNIIARNRSSIRRTIA